MKRKLLTILIVITLFSCNKEEIVTELDFENMNAVSAVCNEDVLLIHNSSLNSSNGTEGMEYNSETGDIVITVESSEEVGYLFEEDHIINVDLDTSSILRRITQIDTLADNIYLKSSDVSLEEVFRDAEFELISDIDEELSLKSDATDEELKNALYSGKQIRPIRITHYTPEGNYIQSVFEDEQIDNLNSIKGEYVKSISFSYNLDGLNIYHDTYSDLSIKTGNISLGADFVLATSIRWGKLKAFRFELKPHANAYATAELNASRAYSKSGEKKLKDNAYKKTFHYWISGIYVSITVDCDIYAGYNFSSQASLYASSYFNATMYADLGARWEKGWSPIRGFYHYEKAGPLNYTINGSADLRVELFPRTTAYIYGSKLISFDIVPYIANHLEAGSNNGANYYGANIKYGLDARISAQIKIIGYTLASYNSGNITMVPPKLLWQHYGK